MTTCKDCFFPAELPHDCSGDMGDLQTTRTVVQFTRRGLYARDKVLREQIAREIEARAIGSVDTKGGFGEAFNQGIVTAAAIARGTNEPL